jgi:hypothetical protein
MDTLYDLLGALPSDDAEGLRKAFRRAVKSAHPDLRPDDPDAAIRFRQIVRANEILLDNDQRAVYDHLLVLAHQEKDPAAAHPIAARIHKIASGVLAFVSLSIVFVGGYLLFMHMSVALVAPTGLAASAATANAIDLPTRLSASIAAVSPADVPDRAAMNAFIAARSESAGVNTPSTANAIATSVAFAPTDKENTSTPADALTDPAPVQSVSLSGNTDSNGAGPEPVTQLDTKLTAPLVDRGLLFFRQRKDEHAFPELPPLKRAEKPGRPKNLLAGAKMRPEPLPKVVPLPQPRTAPRFFQPPPQPWLVSATGS